MKKNSNVKQRKELKTRACIIVEELNLIFDKLKLDPILEALKSNEQLTEFYMKRVFEIIKEYINNEKEEYIETLIVENQHFKSKIETQIKDLDSLKSKINELNNFIREEKHKFDKELAVKNNQIQMISADNEKLNEDSYHMNEKFGNLNDKFNSLNEIYLNIKHFNDQINNENSLLKNKIELLESDYYDLKEKYEELEKLYKNVENEIKAKDDHLIFFKDNFNSMKTHHDNLSIVVDNVVKENENLKVQINHKNLEFQDIANRLEQLRVDYQMKDDEVVNYCNSIQNLQNKIDNVLKVKIKALKNKLKEKVLIIAAKEAEFQEYRTEKERLFAKIIKKNNYND